MLFLRYMLFAHRKCFERPQTNLLFNVINHDRIYLHECLKRGKHKSGFIFWLDHGSQHLCIYQLKAGRAMVGEIVFPFVRYNSWMSHIALKLSRKLVCCFKEKKQRTHGFCTTLHKVTVLTFPQSVTLNEIGALKAIYSKCQKQDLNDQNETLFSLYNRAYFHLVSIHINNIRGLKMNEGLKTMTIPFSCSKRPPGKS